MKSIRIFLMLGILVLLVGSLHVGYVKGQEGFYGNDYRGDASFSNYYSQSDFRDYYRPEGRLETYYPIFGDPQSCIAREDIILQVPPGGCQPSVVRSDLLAEQNVPVFCQIDAIKLNPLIDVKEIRNIRFKGNYPEEVVGTGFHPARAALRTQSRLLGSPIVNNIGYVVFVLRQNPREDELPEVVNFTLNAQLEYYAGNAFGVGKAEFLLEEQTDEEWASDKFRQSFWQGRFFLRLEDANHDFATVQVFDGDRKVSSVRVDRGKTSSEIYVPGSYCQFGLKVAYDGFKSTDEIAKLKVGNDVIDVHRGSRFLNNKCSVRNIEAGELGDGKIDLQCEGDRFTLSIGAREISSVNLETLRDNQILDYFPEVIRTFGDLKDIGDELVIVNKSGNLQFFDRSEHTSEEVVVYNDTGEIVRGSPDEGLISKNISLHTIVGFEGGAGLKETKHPDDNAEFYFRETVAAYEDVIDDYPLVSGNGLVGEETFGERALFAAIELAESYGKEETQSRLINKFLDIYPRSNKAAGLTNKLNKLNDKDFTLAGQSVNLDNGITQIRLLDVRKPKSKASADFFWDGRQLKINFEDTKGFEFGNLTLSRIDADNVIVVPSCREEDGEVKFVQGRSVQLKIGESGEVVCGKLLKLNNADLQETASVRILPLVRGTDVETNFTVGVGIEKRAIDLNPQKAKKKADELEGTIKKWESISDDLGGVVKGLKGACFATSAVLTVKNFFTGLDGEGIARQRVIRDKWKRVCEEEIANGEHGGKLSACYYANRNEINVDVEEMKEILKDFDAEIENLEVSSGVGGLGGLFGERTVDGNVSASALAKSLRNQYGEEVIFDDNGNPIGTVEGLIDANAGYDEGHFGYGQLRDVKFNLDIISSLPESDPLAQEARRRLADAAEGIKDNKAASERLESMRARTSQGYAEPFFGEGAGQRRRVVSVVKIEGSNELNSNKYDWTTGGGARIVHSSTLSTNGASDDSGNVLVPKGNYVLGLLPLDDRTEGYRVVKIYNVDNGKEFSDVAKFSSAFGIGRIVAEDSIVYNNEYKNPEVRYFETEPYKGLPAVVPFDRRKGWYAAAKQALPVLGNVGSFESSGRVASFFLCNVGKNGREQFSEGLGDDQCQLINLNTGQPLDKFPGLTDEDARRLIERAVVAVQSAAEQYKDGVSFVTIGGETYKVGNPSAGIPGTECAEFMSPEECNLLFNVCDPVICPSSRCDLGGAYPVSDVIQTGVVGSALLCLPNVQEGIAVPVCLTGIQAGLDSYVSILKSHQACLREAADNGRLVGICDEVTSVYTCEFFWRQISPATNVLLPKLVEVATGKGGVRGGGEYISVANAWERTQASIDYFTQTYAVNSLEAFNIRSTEEAGGAFCRAFVGGKGIDAFDTLIEPDSPYQFYAWFSSIRFSDVTVPATAQYKAFYHIFAGNDQGISYSVYLKDPPEVSFYRSTPTIQVDTGFIPRGEAVSETIDFTAPEGYQQLCVRINDKEECGFKQVSTDFAVNYLRDEYVSDQIATKNIKSERECISGSPDIRAAVNPNIQAGLEEAGLPEIYDRGVIRICGTENPGSATDPRRFVDVGHCGDEKLRCWLDSKSVDDAITQNNRFLRNETLSEIRSFQKDNLEAEGVILPDSQIESGIKKLSDEVQVFEPTEFNSIVESKANTLVDKSEDLFLKAFFNNHKANLVFLKGEIYGMVAKIFVTKGIGRGGEHVGEDMIVSEEGLGGTTGEIDIGKLRFEQRFSFEEKEGRMRIMYLDSNVNKVYTGLYLIKGDRVIYDDFRSGAVTGTLSSPFQGILISQTYVINILERLELESCILGEFKYGTLDGEQIRVANEGIEMSIASPGVIKDASFLENELAECQDIESDKN